MPMSQVENLTQFSACWHHFVHDCSDKNMRILRLAIELTQCLSRDRLVIANVNPKVTSLGG